MDKRNKIKLNSQVSKLNINDDIKTKVELTSNSKPIPLGDINKILNVGEEFNKERNNSHIYNFVFTITPIFSNVLHNINGNTNLGTFGESNIPKKNNGLVTLNDYIFKNNPYNQNSELTYKESIDNNLKEVDGWFGFYNPDLTKNEPCDFYDLEPTRGRFDLNSNINKNWDITLTYPKSKNDQHHLVKGGLLIVECEKVNVGGIDMVAFGTSTRHGLNNGDRVVLSELNNSSLDGEYVVKLLGFNGDLKDNYFVIDLNPDQLNLGNSFTDGRVKRVVNNVVSEYYVRNYGKIDDISNDDYEIYPLSFSINIFNDSIYQLVFNKDLNLDGLTDNLGRPLSEVFLTFIKTNSDGMFSPLKSGFDLELMPGNVNNNVSNVRLMTNEVGNDLLQTPIETNINIMYNEFSGDIVEYNKIELKEIVLTEVYHRFNTIDRETSYEGVADGPRREGYIVNPNRRVKIKQFSTYIEQGDESTINKPFYSVDLGDGRYIWRDLLDLGIPNLEGEVIDYPFTNGRHYIYENFCLDTKRQDPFGYYGLYYKGVSDSDNFSPSDPIGDGVTDKYNVKIQTDEC